MSATGEGFPELGIYTELGRVGKALASPIRLRLLDILTDGERTVEELAADAHVNLKNTSSQLQILRAAQLVAGRRDGVRIHYRLASDDVAALLGVFHRFSRDNVAAVRTEVEMYFAEHADLTPLTAAELRSRLDDGSVLVIDVRPRHEYERGHIPGAISIPLGELREHLDALPTDRRIIAYCQGPYCVASPTAASELAAAQRDSTYVDGGITSWIWSGGRLESA
ncbi:ArsR/SmtB family transcription factor [Gordonia sp. DT30]|uniref:ArsR/SmtB family transcription factor n=1 Tax=Gordonia sp. DT30 TaxID=3416546 RepID=UPI003CE7BC0C